MTFRYVHVSIGYSTSTQNPQALEPVIGVISRDWARYNSNCWILWTDKSNIECMNFIRPHLFATDQLLIHTMDMRDLPVGTLPIWLWDWINRRRDASNGYIHFPVAQSALEQAFNSTSAQPAPLLPSGQKR
jgi:hypothetical protein